MKIKTSVILKALSLVVGVAGLLLSQALDSHNQNELKAELKKDILNELQG